MVTAALTLAVVVALLGPALQYLIPIDVLRLVVGTLLLIFGLQWLRKAIMRYTGLKELHDAERIYQREIAELTAAPQLLAGLVRWWSLVLLLDLNGIYSVFQGRAPRRA